VAHAAPSPPHDLDAERALISACFLDFRTKERPLDSLDKAIVALSPQGSAVFFDRANGLVFEAMVKLRKQGDPVEMVTVASELKRAGTLQRVGGTAYLATLTEAVFSLEATETHAQRLRECWEDRNLIDALQRIVAEGYRIPGYRDDWWTAARAEASKAFARKPKRTGSILGEVMDRAKAQVDLIRAGKLPGVRWGFRAVEQFGLLARKRQVIVAGRPGIGKTAFGSQVAVNVAETKPDANGVREAVVVFSYEMPGEELFLRLACSGAGFNYLDFEANQLEPDAVKTIGEWFCFLRSLPLVVEEDKAPPGQMAERVMAHRHDFERGKVRDANRDLFPPCRLQLVVADQLSEVPIPPGLPPKLEHRKVIGEKVKALRDDIAINCDVALITLAQLHRLPRDRKAERPTMADLAESGDIEQIANAIGLIHREEYHLGPTCPLDSQGIAEFIWAKGRMGTRQNNIARLGFSNGFFRDL
jgi:replicative DNA helicase